MISALQIHQLQKKLLLKGMPLMQLSKAVDSIHERTAQLGRTVDDRLVDLEVKSKAKDDELGGKVRWPLMLSTLSSTRAE